MRSRDFENLRNVRTEKGSCSQVLRVLNYHGCNPRDNNANTLRRSVVICSSPSEQDEQATARIVSLLARGLERLLAGKGIERDGDEVETDLDFLPHQSVTTDEALGSSEGYR